MMPLEVAVAAPLFQTLTYVCPPRLQGGTDQGSIGELIGCRVLVPLGRRVVTGFVLGGAGESQTAYELKSIREVLDEQGLFPLNCVPFFRWIAEYYQYPIGEVISTALPAGLKRSSQKQIRLATGREENVSVLAGFEQKPDWWEELLSKGELNGAKTRQILNRKKEADLVDKLVAEGILQVEQSITESNVREKKELCYFSNYSFCESGSGEETEAIDLEGFCQAASSVLGDQLKLSESKALYHYSRLAGHVGDHVPRKDILKAYKSGGKALDELCRRGVLEKSSKRIYRNPFGELPTFHRRPESLSCEQAEAVAQVVDAIDKKKFSPFLLYGVTGSGKTEVYLQAAEHCLQQGLDILVLVPEIALATQLESHFVSRFGNSVALLHSGLSRGERFDQWSLAAQGKAKIIIGARSAVFAPLANLGLIIVDEEHDGGFKQHDGLKYNGRDLAVLRANQLGCAVILGSATPSVTSYNHAIAGKYLLLRMENRVGEAVLPRVDVIDLSAEEKRNAKGPFQPRFLAEIEKNLARGEQSLVLLNRRGFSASYLCSDCGTAVQCNHCNVSLTYHKKREKLLCHYCGYTVGSRLICANCHSETLVPYGFGTERVEEELRSHFPLAEIQRLDSDTAADRKRFLAILKAMRNREIDILIGTQMIAKGHHFPFVTFVGVVWADGGLNMPDFRAAERTFQLLSQVTGRAGRGNARGRVLIQTMRPNHYAIALAKSHDYERFYQQEIRTRQRPAFPPHVRLASYRITGDLEYNVKKTAMNIAAACRHLAQNKTVRLEVLGPAPAPLEKIKDNYRWQVLLKSPQVTTLHMAGGYTAENEKKLVVGNTRIVFDMDPENMM